MEILQSSPNVGEFGPEGDHDEKSEAEEFFNDDIQTYGQSNDIVSRSIPLVNASYDSLARGSSYVVGHF